MLPKTPVSHCKSNDCHPLGANCLEEEDGYFCQCKPGWKDMGGSEKPGQNCRRIGETDECADSTLNTCHPLATCFNLPVGYKCECNASISYDAAVEDDVKMRGRLCIPCKRSANFINLQLNE